jgi:anti-sigma factor RsiW
VTVSDRDVMRLFDGELDPDEARRIAVERRGDPSVNTRLAGLSQVAAFTRVWARERGVKVPSRPLPRREWTLSRRLAFGGAVASLTALTALFLFGPGTTSGSAFSVPKSLVPAAAVAVEQVDFGSHAGTIFSVSAAGTETTVVWLSDDADENSLAL